MLKHKSRILYVVPHDFLKPSTGSTHRTKALYDAMCACSDVDYVVTGLASENEITADRKHKFALAGINNFLKKLIPFHGVTKHKQTIWKLLKSGIYDIVVVRYINTYISIGLPSFPKLIIDFDDNPISAFKHSTPASINHPLRSLRKNFLSQLLKYYVYTASTKACQLWISNPDDQYAFNKVRIIPNSCPPILSTISSKKSTFKYIFAADMRYKPNIDALLYYCDNIHPELLSRCGSAELVVCGHFDSSLLPPRVVGQEGITFAGFVPNISEIYSECSAAIAPMVSGSGTSVKVMEAIGAGLPCVGTPEAYRGYVDEVREELPFLLAMNAEEFTEKMLRLGDPVTNDLKMKQMLAHFAKKHWSEDLVRKRVRAALFPFFKIS